MLSGERRVQAVQAVAGMRHRFFDGRVWRVSVRTLYRWLRAHESQGLAALENRRRKRPPDTSVLPVRFVEFLESTKKLDARASGARLGFIMLARPRVGRSYQQEFAPGVAEDRARIVSLRETVSVPFGTFQDCLKTLDTTPLNPNSREYKFYARGVGQILTVSIPNGQRTELTSVTGK